MRNINERFCTEAYDDNGLLTDFKVSCPDDFNFAYDVVDDIAVNDPERTAMVWCNPEGEEHVFTFAAMKYWSDKTANFLRAQGIGKGDMVLVILRRNYQFWFTALALQKLGAVLVPATFMLRESDLAYRLNGASIKAVICTNVGDIAEIVDHVVYMCPSVRSRILVNAAGGGTTPKRPDGSFEFPANGQPFGPALSGPDGVCALGCVRKGWVDFNTNVRVSSANLERVPTKVTDPMLMYFSSGTSGEPKMVLHNGYYAAAHIVTAKHWHNTVADGGLHFTISDTGWGKAVWGKFYGQWFMESAVLTYDFDRFDAKEILALIGRYHVTTFCCPPTMYRIIMTTANVDDYDLSSLVYCTTAGEPLNPDLFTFWKEHVGLTIFEGFGQTETPLTVGNLTGSTPRIGSMGKPVPQYDTHILREDGTECEPGETGEICINIAAGAPGIMMEYYRNPEKTVAAMHDGWYHTGDTAWADREGYYWYEGRNDDLIKSSGYRISPFEIESVLLEHGAVKECAVTGVPDALRGQAVKATVVLMDGFEGSDELTKALQTWVKHHTAPYKFPRIIEYVDELPRTISGKIRHVEIRSTDADRNVESCEELDEADALVPDHEVNKLDERAER